jgi:S-adenosylmethionine:tRNA ribosyltransferase-isomerase
VLVSDFDYELPEELVAQEALPDRAASRLLVLGRRSGAIEHHVFAELPSLLRAGDLVVLNDTRVLPARLRARKPSGGAVEILLLEPDDPAFSGSTWRCLLNASRPPSAGTRLSVAPGFDVVVIERRGEAWAARLEGSGDARELLERHGEMPLPPYVRRSPDDPRAARDRDRYQTVYARRPGAVAAPTAGLHFTAPLLDALREAGIGVAFLTLHVGIGTFLPVRAERVEDHRMHAETFDLPEATASAIVEARRAGGRVVAVGTTVARTLEARAKEGGAVVPGSGRCDLFLRPGATFRAVDALVTNFHLPRSTLLMLVAAFAGTESVLAAYREAVRLRYRFYSYGDAMLVRPG